jgi:ferrous iron transport protein B
MAHALIALAGNPNAGKSTIFNALTGGRQHTGNWPGKTVEKKAGTLKHQGQTITIVDLPGIYSLSAYSLEEQIARDFLVDEQPHAVVNVVDAANLERNLYLTMQMLETGLPLILALNMTDIAATRQITIDAGQLSTLLQGVPVISMVASTGTGMAALQEAIIAITQQRAAVEQPDRLPEMREV